MATNGTPDKLKVGDRVKRTGKEGCVGIVQEIREEVTIARTTKNPEHSDRSALIGVLWDNGTLSYFSPEGLSIAKS